MRLWLQSVFLWTAVCFLPACGEDQSTERRLSEKDKFPHVLGKVLIGVDNRLIVLCDSREACVDVEPPKRVCALEMNRVVGDALRALSDEVGGEYWISGHAATAAPGHFGHLGAEACLVIFRDVTKVDDGPPRMWTPPPPTEASGS